MVTDNPKDGGPCGLPACRTGPAARRPWPSIPQGQESAEAPWPDDLYRRGEISCPAGPRSRRDGVEAGGTAAPVRGKSAGRDRARRKRGLAARRGGRTTPHGRRGGGAGEDNGRDGAGSREGAEARARHSRHYGRPRRQRGLRGGGARRRPEDPCGGGQGTAPPAGRPAQGLLRAPPPPRSPPSRLAAGPKPRPWSALGTAPGRTPRRPRWPPGNP